MAEHHDRLLEWCSARLDGTRAVFTEALEFLCGLQSATEAYRELSQLERLGHLEIDWTSGANWCVTPAALTLLRNAGGNALFVGMRPPGFEDVVREYARAHKLTFTVREQPNGPAAWYLGFCDDAMVRDAANDLGLVHVPRASRRYADLLPTITAQVEAHRSFFRPGRTACQRFVPESLSFEPYEGSRELEEGLYQFQDYGPASYVIVGPGTSTAVLRDRWVAVHFDLLRQRRRRNLRTFHTVGWHPETETLYSRAKVQLPQLAARAATLSTGLLPDRMRFQPDHSFPDAYYDCYPGVVAPVFSRIRKYLQLDEGTT
jgi:hypothetical protein